MPYWSHNPGKDITREKQLEVEKTIALTQIKRNFAELAILHNGIRNPLTIIALLTESYCPDKFAEFENQIIKINQIVNQLDIGWVESESVLNFLNNHYIYPGSDKKEKSGDNILNRNFKKISLCFYLFEHCLSL